MVEAPLLIVFIPVTVAWLIWMVIFLSNDPSEELRHTKRHQFLGPGGPDDPFAETPYYDEQTQEAGEEADTPEGNAA